MATKVSKREPMMASPFFRRGPLAMLREEMRDLFDYAVGDGEELWPFGRTVPSTDLSETGESVEVRMDLPGVKPEEVDIQVSGNVLTISGQRQEEREEKNTTWHRIERRLGSFSRSVMLPCPIKEEAIEAHYREGVLTVTLPKADEVKAHKVKVTA